jgi:peroxiredoxin
MELVMSNTKEGSDMAMTSEGAGSRDPATAGGAGHGGHDEGWVTKLPQGPFDLSGELGRWREIRNVVMPVDVIAGMDRGNAELAGSAVLDRVPQVGSRAPDFVLPDADGRPVSLARMLERGSVVLSFYRGIWCPFCNLELSALQNHLPQITELGASLVAISEMTSDNSMSLVERLDLTYEVLTDAGLVVADRYGLAWELPDHLRDLYARLGHPVSQFNGGGRHILPIPGTFVVDTGGIIRFAYANVNYMYRADPVDIVSVLERLATAGSSAGRAA